MIRLKNSIEHALVAFYRRTIHARPRLVLGLTALAIACLVIPLTALRVDPSLQLALPGGEPWDSLRTVERELPVAPTIVLSLPARDPFSDASFKRMQGLTGALLSHAELWAVQSAATGQDARVSATDIETIPVAPDLVTARERLGSSPLMKALYLSPSLDAWTITLALKNGFPSGGLLSALREIRHVYPELRCAGAPYLEALVREKLLRELVILLPVCAAVLLFLYLILLRRPRQALVLWGASLVPTAICCALFPLTGTPLKVYTILAPFLTLALSTSYSMHILYGMRFFNGNPEKALASRGPIVLLDAAAAALGFLTLLFSPIMELRSLGAFVAAGVLVSLAVAFIPFMALLDLIAPAMTESPRPLFRKDRSSASPTAPRRFVTRVAVMIPVLCLACVGVSRTSIGNRLVDQFPPWSDEAQEIQWMQGMYGGLEDLVLDIDSGKEIGLADPKLFTQVASFQKTASATAGVARVVSYVDLVQGIESRLDPQGGGSLSEPAIAEDMELAVSLSVGGLTGTFFDSQERRARVSIVITPSESRPSTLAIVEDLSRSLDFVGLGGRYQWGGTFLTQAYLDDSFAREQLLSVAILLAGFAMFLTFVFGSLRSGLLALLPPIIGIVTALGFLGLMGWRLNQANVLALVAVAGLSVDGAIMCLMIESNSATRHAIRDAFILMPGAILSLALSSFFQIFQTVVACSLGLAAATFTVLFIVDPARGPAAQLVRRGRNV